MTIEVKGHVHSLEFCGSLETKVTLHLESSRLAEHPHQVTIRAKPTEIESYRVGMPVVVMIRPAAP